MLFLNIIFMLKIIFIAIYLCLCVIAWEKGHKTKGTSFKGCLCWLLSMAQRKENGTRLNPSHSSLPSLSKVRIEIEKYSDCAKTFSQISVRKSLNPKVGKKIGKTRKKNSLVASEAARELVGWMCKIYLKRS